MSRYEEVREKIFYAFRRKFVNDNEILPWWGVVVRFLILPLDTFYHLLHDNQKIYDLYSDTYVLEGKKYSRTVFRNLAYWPIGTTFEIVDRDDTIHLKRLNKVYLDQGEINMKTQQEFFQEGVETPMQGKMRKATSGNGNTTQKGTFTPEIDYAELYGATTPPADVQFQNSIITESAGLPKAAPKVK